MTVKDLIGKNRWILLGLGLSLVYGVATRIARPVSLVGLRRWRDGCGVSLRDRVRNGLSHRLDFGAPVAASSVDVVYFAVALRDWRYHRQLDFTTRRIDRHRDVFADRNGLCHDWRRDRWAVGPVFTAQALERANCWLRRIPSSAHYSVRAERSLREGDTECEHLH